MFYVYAVIDPETNNPVYIGQTNDVKKRMAGHRSSAYRAMKYGRGFDFHMWLADLIKKNIMPEVKILLECKTREGALEGERQIIHSLERRGNALQNKLPIYLKNIYHPPTPPDTHSESAP